MRPNFSALSLDPSDQFEGHLLILRRLHGKAEDQIHLRRKTMLQSQLAGLLDLASTVAPTDAAEDRRAA